MDRVMKTLKAHRIKYLRNHFLIRTSIIFLVYNICYLFRRHPLCEIIDLRNYRGIIEIGMRFRGKEDEEEYFQEAYYGG